jgi:hypothetical protein
MIPKNSIIIKSTSGGEYVDRRTNTPYKGYYYEYKNKVYAGTDFATSGSVELISVDEAKILFNNAYSAATGLTAQSYQSPIINSVITFTDIHRFDNSTLHFYYKKYNDNVIKEIDENTYLNLKNNPLYITTYTGLYNNINQTPSQAIEQLPGLDIFLSDVDSDGSQV